MHLSSTAITALFIVRCPEALPSRFNTGFPFRTGTVSYTHLERSADRYNGFAAPVQPMVHAAFIAPAVYTLAFVLGYRQICKCL